MIQDFSGNSKGKYNVIGSRPIRHDGWDKVTGRAIYGADIRIPDLLYGKIKRSPHAHARILSINTRVNRATSDTISYRQRPHTKSAKVGIIIKQIAK